jgi:hypothetical protein
MGYAASHREAGVAAHGVKFAPAAPGAHATGWFELASATRASDAPAP